MMQHCFTIRKEFAVTDINGNANRELSYNIKRMGKTLCSKDKKDNPLSTFMSYSKSSHRPNACVCKCVCACLGFGGVRFCLQT